MSRRVSIVAGVLLWCGIGLGLFAASRPLDGQVAGPARVAGSLASYVTTASGRYELLLEEGVAVLPHDPIFVAGEKGALELSGEIRGEGGESCAAVLYPGSPPPGARGVLLLHESSDSLGFAFETLLPPQRRDALVAELSAGWAKHRDEILPVVQPLIDESLAVVVDEIERELPESIARRSDEWQALATRLEREVAEAELLPVAREEIFPALRKRTEPLLNEIGREAFAKASLWRFFWRAAYDRSPLPPLNLVDKEWERFVDEDLEPLIAEHSDDFTALAEDLLQDASQNERVQEALGRSLRHVMNDREFRRLAEATARDVLVENPRLRTAVIAVWTSEDAKARLKQALSPLEPTFRRMGDEVLGTEDGGLTPELAAVLRRQILLKDRRWLVLEVDTSPSDPAAAVDGSSARPVLAVRRAALPAVGSPVRAAASGVKEATEAGHER